MVRARPTTVLRVAVRAVATLRRRSGRGRSHRRRSWKGDRQSNHKRRKPSHRPCLPLNRPHRRSSTLVRFGQFAITIRPFAALGQWVVTYDETYGGCHRPSGVDSVVRRASTHFARPAPSFSVQERTCFMARVQLFDGAWLAGRERAVSEMANDLRCARCGRAASTDPPLRVCSCGGAWRGPSRARRRSH